MGLCGVRRACQSHALSSRMLDEFPLFLMMVSSLKKTTQALAASSLGWLATASVAYAELFGDVPPIGADPDDPRGAVIGIIEKVLSFMALIAVVIIVIAGIRLVVSQGDETAVDKGKKTILFAVIGLIVILLASAIVGFVADIATT